MTFCSIHGDEPLPNAIGPFIHVVHGSDAACRGADGLDPGDANGGRTEPSASASAGWGAERARACAGGAASPAAGRNISAAAIAAESVAGTVDFGCFGCIGGFPPFRGYAESTRRTGGILVMPAIGARMRQGFVQFARSRSCCTSADTDERTRENSS